jgi:hypothetical protein
LIKSHEYYKSCGILARVVWRVISIVNEDMVVEDEVYHKQTTVSKKDMGRLDSFQVNDLMIQFIGNTRSGRELCIIYKLPEYTDKQVESISDSVVQTLFNN